MATIKSNEHESAKPGNGVEIATLVLAAVGSIAAFIKFETLDSKIGNLDIAKTRHENQQFDEPILTVTGTINPGSISQGNPGDPYHSTRLATLTILLKNDGQTDLKVEHVIVQLFKRSHDKRWETLRDEVAVNQGSEEALPLPIEADSSQPASPDEPQRTDAIPATNGELVPTSTPPSNDHSTVQVEFIDPYNDWEEVGTAWRYELGSRPFRMRHGQSRALDLHYLVRDGEMPELLKFSVQVQTAPVDRQSHIASWVGITGSGPFRRLFQSEALPEEPGPVNSPTSTSW